MQVYVVIADFLLLFKKNLGRQLLRGYIVARCNCGVLGYSGQDLHLLIYNPVSGMNLNLVVIRVEIAFFAAQELFQLELDEPFLQALVALNLHEAKAIFQLCNQVVGVVDAEDCRAALALEVGGRGAILFRTRLLPPNVQRLEAPPSHLLVDGRPELVEEADEAATELLSSCLDAQHLEGAAVLELPAAEQHRPRHLLSGVEVEDSVSHLAVRRGPVLLEVVVGRDANAGGQSLGQFVLGLASQAFLVAGEPVEEFHHVEAGVVVLALQLLRVHELAQGLLERFQ